MGVLNPPAAEMFPPTPECGISPLSPPPSPSKLHLLKAGTGWEFYTIGKDSKGGDSHVSDSVLILRGPEGSHFKLVMLLCLEE